MCNKDVCKWLTLVVVLTPLVAGVLEALGLLPPGATVLLARRLAVLLGGLPRPDGLSGS